MKNLNLPKEAVIWALLLVPFIYIAYIWNTLPDSIPIHFGLNGEPNGWTGKWGVFILPALNVGLYLLLLFLPVIDPKRMGQEQPYGNFYKMRLVIALFLVVFTLILAAYPGNTGLHGRGNWLYIAIFAMLALMGNYMVNIKPNWFAGIRTPWTLSNNAVWKQTHLIFGRLWFYGGLAGMALTYFLPTAWAGGLLFVFAIGSALFGYAYSYWLFKKDGGVQG